MMNLCRLPLGSLPLVAILSLGAAPASAELTFGNAVVELDDDDGYLTVGAIGGTLSEGTSWDLALSRSEIATVPSDLVTTSIDASLYHDYGSVGVRVGLGGWVDQDFVTGKELTAAADVHAGGFSIVLETRLRYSDFEPFTVDRTVVLRDGTAYTISALADCAVDNVGLGARLRWSSHDGDWRFAVNGMRFDYDDFGCHFGAAVLERLRNATRDEFVQLADRVADVLSTGAGRRLALESSFLDSRAGFSVSRRSGARSYSLYYDAVEGLFFGRRANTLSVGVAFVLASGSEIEVYTGVTTGDTRPDVAFLGLSLLIAR